MQFLVRRPVGLGTAFLSVLAPLVWATPCSAEPAGKSFDLCAVNSSPEVSPAALGKRTSEERTDLNDDLRLTPVAQLYPEVPWPYFVGGTAMLGGLGTFALYSSPTRWNQQSPDTSQAREHRRRLAQNIGLGVALISAAGLGFYYYFSRSSVSVIPKMTGSTVRFKTRF